jgi:3-dehydrotetronate 4-kinase
MFLGAVADDVTGATDLASLIRRNQCNVILSFGTPSQKLPETDAVVIATKSRMVPASEATSIASRAAACLLDAGATQIYFKYCSTFDSTPKGNIGPVIEALLAQLSANFTVACPSYPEHARTVYQGHLFVGEKLISQSSMRHHPLTPMTDPDLVGFLGLQCDLPVGLIPFCNVDAGPAAIQERFKSEEKAGRKILIADAICNRHINSLAEACRKMKLVSGGAALGAALVAQQVNRKSPAKQSVMPRRGPVVLLSGSCSTTTLSQVQFVKDRVRSFQIDPFRLIEDPGELDRIQDWASCQVKCGDLLIYSTADSQVIRKIQTNLGREAAAGIVEYAFERIAVVLAGEGVRTFVVAGGETSGAVIQGLGIRTLTFGEELDPGVPWAYSLDPEGFTFALKSGNFGGPDFFVRALRQ